MEIIYKNLQEEFTMRLMGWVKIMEEEVLLTCESNRGTENKIK